MDIKKALQTDDSGQYLIPEKLAAGITELAEQASPLRKLIKRIPWTTNAYEWTERSALASTDWYSENASFSASESTYTRKSKTVKMLKVEGTVSNLLIKTSRDYIPALQAEIEGASKSIAMAEEEAIITGDSSSDSDQIDGLYKQITQQVDAEGGVITFDLLDEAIRAVRLYNGIPGLIVVSPRDLDKLIKTVRDAGYYLPFEKATAIGNMEIRLAKYQGIPVLSTPFIPTDLDSSQATPESDCSYAFVLDLNEIVIAEVLPLTYEEVAVTTDGKSFRIKEYIALAVKAAGKKHCTIINIGKE